MNKILTNQINYDIRHILPTVVENIPTENLITNILREQYLEKADEINQLNLGNAGSLSEDLTSILNVDDNNLKGIGLASVAGIHTYNGNYKNALAGLNEALNLKVHDDVKAYIFTEYANLLRMLKRTDEALIIFNRASELTSNENLKWRINTYIGYTLQYIDSVKALKILNKSADFYLKNTNYTKYTTVLRHIGLIYSFNNNFKSAKKYFSVVNNIATQYSLDSVINDTDNDLGWLSLQQGKFNEAKDIFMDLLNREIDSYSRSLVFQNLGVLEFNRENYSESIKFHCNSLEITSKYDMYEMLIEDYYRIGLSYENIGSYKLAEKYYREGYNLLKSERNELGIILLTGYRKVLIDNYIRFLESKPFVPSAGLHNETFEFTKGKNYKNILDVFQENLLKIHRRRNKTIEQLCKSLDISLRLYFVYQNRFGLSREKMKEIPNINPHFRNYLFSLVNSDWRTAKNQFDNDLYRFLLAKHGHNKTNIANILDVSNLTVIKKTAKLD